MMSGAPDAGARASERGRWRQRQWRVRGRVPARPLSLERPFCPACPHLDHLRRDSPDSPSLCPVGIRGHPTPRSPSLLCLGYCGCGGGGGSGPCCTPPFPMALLQPLPYLSLPQVRPTLSVPSSRRPKPCGGGNTPLSLSLHAFVWSGHPARPGRPYLSDTGLGHSLLSGLEGTLGAPQSPELAQSRVGRPGAPPFHICTACSPCSGLYLPAALVEVGNSCC